MKNIKSGYYSINPYTGENQYSKDFDTSNEVEIKVKQSIDAFNWLSNTSSEKRKNILKRIADGIERQKDELAELVTSEMGKPLKQAKGEIGKCIEMALWHAEHGEELLANENTEYNNQKYTIVHQPLGPALFIATWNNPFLQATLAIVPQITVGNSALIKPAPNAPRCAEALKNIIDGLDINQDIYQILYTDIPLTEQLLLDKRITGVTFIGSSKAGHRIAELAGKSFKSAVIDAGGSDPMIVLKDCDIDKAVEGAIAARYGNTGQSCVAAKRIIVDQSIIEEFSLKFVEATKQLQVGDPMNKKTDIGPLAIMEAKTKLEKQIQIAINEGAEVLYHKSSEDLSGACVYPTILAGVTCEMLPSKEELFGPVAAIYAFNSIDEAIKIANDTPFGLGASIYGSQKTANDIALKLNTGNVAINTKIATQFPIPFGGMKDSGFGVYFGKEGLTTFCNSKIISTPK